jgi:hypothetical protein
MKKSSIKKASNLELRETLCAANDMLHTINRQYCHVQHLIPSSIENSLTKLMGDINAELDKREEKTIN